MMLMMALLVCSCNKEEPEQEEHPIKEILLSKSGEKLIDNTNAFAVNFLKTFESSKKIFISPFSVACNLAMFANGTDAETANEIAVALGYEPDELDVVNEDFETIIKGLPNVSKNASVVLANSIWLQKGLTFNPKFKETAEKSYNAKLETIDLYSENFGDKINNWLKKVSNGKLSQDYESLDLPHKRTSIVVNALALSARWDYKYWAFPFRFVNESGYVRYVKALRADWPGKFLGCEDDKAAYMQFPFNGFYLAILLPSRNTTLTEYLKDFSIDDWNRYAKNVLRSDLCEARFPVFEAACDADISENMRRIGINKLFAKPDLSGMYSPFQGDKLAILHHNVHLKFDNKGIDATAVTSGVNGYNIDPEPPKPVTEFIVDRPFIYAICEESTGLILFMGKVHEL